MAFLPAILALLTSSLRSLLTGSEFLDSS